MKLIDLIKNYKLTDMFKIKIRVPKDKPTAVSSRGAHNALERYEYYCFILSVEELIGDDYLILLNKEVLSIFFECRTLTTVTWIELTNKEMEVFLHEA